jgi:hypothetical protein
LTPITLAQVHHLFRPLSVVFVRYLDQDLTARAIELGEDGNASHVLCCLGGLDIIEADIGGIMHTNLDTYLRGQCHLTIKRPRHALSAGATDDVERYWLGTVGAKYDVGRIVGLLPVMAARAAVRPFSARAARWVEAHVPNLLASRTLNTCDVEYVRGIRKGWPEFLEHFPAAAMTPRKLERDVADLELVQTLDAPLLSWRGRR